MVSESKNVLQSSNNNMKNQFSNYTNYTKSRFEVGSVSIVIQNRFKIIAKRLNLTIGEAVEEALQDWNEKHFSQANLPIDKVPIQQNGKYQEKEKIKISDYRNDKILYAQHIALKKSTHNSIVISRLMEDYKNRNGIEAYQNILLPILRD